MKNLTMARARRNVSLGPALGRGGEGSVFAIEGRSDQVAKIYTVPPESMKVQKLFTMVETASPAILGIAAWPVDLLVGKSGAVCGFVMPRVTARRDIHELYSPKSRFASFPEADFRFLVHVGSNIARAFAVVHEQGHVIGDVNHGNLLVGPDGTVMLIDCDSFQVRSSTRVFTCDVGVPLFTAPELQRQSFRGLRRTADHDRFGLAVLLFHLLFMGRHPFAGRYTGPGEMPIERAISEYRFAYGPDRAACRMERPPGTAPLEAMGTTVTQLFVKAFDRLGSREARPDGMVWVQALENLKSNLRVCFTARWHHYLGALRECPWCEIEKNTGARLFGQRILGFGPSGTVDLAALWRAIESVPDPGPDPPTPSEKPWPPPLGAQLPRGQRKALRIAASLTLMLAAFASCAAIGPPIGFWAALLQIGIGIVLWPRVSAEKRLAAQTACASARADWSEVLARWNREASRSSFAQELEVLGKVHSELADLPKERSRRLAALERGREARQKERFLDRFRLDAGKIRDIGPSRTAMLASYGIETAADISARTIQQIPQIPGFGKHLTSQLVKWRKGHEGKFRFNPKEPVDPGDVATVDQELESRRQNLSLVVSQGPQRLHRLSQEIIAARRRVAPMLERSWSNLKLAEAQLKAL